MDEQIKINQEKFIGNLQNEIAAIIVHKAQLKTLVDQLVEENSRLRSKDKDKDSE